MAQFMRKTFFLTLWVASVSVVFVAYGQTSGRQEAAPQRALLDKYCIGCHNQRTSNGLPLDAKSIDLEHAGASAEKFEKVIRKLRAGMMPPSGAARPEAPALEALAAWLENELDRSATLQLPAPGLHRLNRTEYTN